MAKKYYFHNLYHLGDNVFNIIFFKIIKSYIEKNNIIIHYYCQPEYINQVSEFNDSPNVIIEPIQNKPTHSLELWIDREMKGLSWTNTYNKNCQSGLKRSFYDSFFVSFFNNVLEIIKINLTIKTFYYKDSNLKHRYVAVNKQFNNKYRKLDILILNSQPMSGQFKYNKLEWDEHIRYLHNAYKVMTTTKVDGVPCTMDDNLTIKDIAAISARVKIIIAVNSGVVPGLLNKYTLNNVKHVYIFDDRCKFSYKKFENLDSIKEISVANINKYI
jgi:hypothetical protein